MISHKYKCIFVHVPKTGGESISVLLGANPDPIKLRFLPKKHVGIRYYKKNNRRAFRNYFKFSIVRNPWDAAVSHASWKEKVLKKSKEPLTKKKFEYYMYKNFRKSFFVKHRPRRMLFIDDVLQVNIIRFENINEDFEHIRKALNIEENLPHKNKTNHKSYKEYYNEETIEMVRSCFKKDIEYFGYEF